MSTGRRAAGLAVWVGERAARRHRCVLLQRTLWRPNINHCNACVHKAPNPRVILGWRGRAAAPARPAPPTPEHPRVFAIPRAESVVWSAPEPPSPPGSATGPGHRHVGTSREERSAEANHSSRHRPRPPPPDQAGPGDTPRPRAGGAGTPPPRPEGGRGHGTPPGATCRARAVGPAAGSEAPEPGTRQDPTRGIVNARGVQGVTDTPGRAVVPNLCLRMASSNAFGQGAVDGSTSTFRDQSKPKRPERC